MNEQNAEDKLRDAKQAVDEQLPPVEHRAQQILAMEMDGGGEKCLRNRLEKWRFQALRGREMRNRALPALASRSSGCRPMDNKPHHPEIDELTARLYAIERAEEPPPEPPKPKKPAAKKPKPAA